MTRDPRRNVSIPVESHYIIDKDTVGFKMNVKPSTILTNLQRGNVKQESPALHRRTIHELAAQGELYNIDRQLVDIHDSSHMTPLIWAASYGQNSTVDYLLKSGADVNHKSVSGRTALMFAASRGFFHVVKTLIAGGAFVDDTDDQGNSALMYAAHQDQALVVQELLKKGANLSLMNQSRQTAYSLSLNRESKASQASIEAHMLSLLKSPDNNQRQWH